MTTTQTTASRSRLRLLYLRQMFEDLTDADHGLTMPQIIGRLAQYDIHAERKALYRDIDALRESGMDIRTYNRNPIEYGLAHRGFETAQLMLLVDAVESSRFLTQRQSRMLVSNIKCLASSHQRELLDKRIHVAGRVRSKNDSVFAEIDKIHQALRQRREISFLYCKYGPGRERVVQHGGKPYVRTPVKVVFADGFYYATTYSEEHDSFADFRVDRMQKLQVLDTSAARNDRIAAHAFDEDDYQYFGRFGGDAVRPTLRVEPDKIDILIDRFGDGVQFSQDQDGTVLASVAVRKSEQFFGWIAGLGGKVAIARPEWLVAEYKDYLRKLIEA